MFLYESYPFSNDFDNIRAPPGYRDMSSIQDQTEINSIIDVEAKMRVKKSRRKRAKTPKVSIVDVDDKIKQETPTALTPVEEQPID